MLLFFSFLWPSVRGVKDKGSYVILIFIFKKDYRLTRNLKSFKSIDDDTDIGNHNGSSLRI